MNHILDIKGVSVKFPIRGGVLGRIKDYFHAVDDVSFYIRENETFGLVGESGSGKSTIAKSILRLNPHTTGEILFHGQNILRLPRSDLRQLRKNIQIVFQDPYASMNPRQKIGSALVEVLMVHRMFQRKQDAYDYAKEMLEMVGLNAETVMNSLPKQLSGGMRQRVGIARALLLQPNLVILDEPTSFLDISVQARLLELLKELQAKMKLTYLFISHDLNVVGYMSDRIGVMYRGKLVELADTDDIFDRPRHPYTKLLLSSILSTDPDQPTSPEEKESDMTVSRQGCRFQNRCPFAKDECKHKEPPLREVDSGHLAACHYI